MLVVTAMVPLPSIAPLLNFGAGVMFADNRMSMCVCKDFDGSMSWNTAVYREQGLLYCTKDPSEVE